MTCAPLFDVAAPRARVLVADDHEIVRKGLCTLLGSQPGWEIAAEARDGREAVKLAKECKPDVAVLDISMPGGSGLEVLEAAKREQPAPIVMMLTNLAYEQYREKCRQLGADYFFDKSTEFQKAKDVLIKLGAVGIRTEHGAREQRDDSAEPGAPKQ